MLVESVYTHTQWHAHMHRNASHVVCSRLQARDTMNETSRIDFANRFCHGIAATEARHSSSYLRQNAPSCLWDKVIREYSSTAYKVLRDLLGANLLFTECY